MFCVLLGSNTASSMHLPPVLVSSSNFPCAELVLWQQIRGANVCCFEITRISVNPNILPFSELAAPRVPRLSWTAPLLHYVSGPPVWFHWSEKGNTNKIGVNVCSLYSLYYYFLLLFQVTGLHVNHYYREDLVTLLQPSINRCHSIFFDFGHKYTVVIYNIRQVHTSNYVEAQA